MSKVIFVGLDLECTGSNYDDGARMCQIGVSFGPLNTFEQDICYGNVLKSEVPNLFKSDGALNAMTEEALKVNGFTIDRILDVNGPSVVATECATIQFIKDYFKSIEEEVCELVPIGWNVGSFDMRFVRVQMPNLTKMFSYRAVDLNAICFTLAGKQSRTGIYNFYTWKKKAKEYANKKLQELGIKKARHTAGYDAACALLEWEWLKKQIDVSVGGIV